MTDWLMIERGEGQRIPLVLIPGWGFTGAVLKDHPVFAGETLVMSTGFTSPDMLVGLVEFLQGQDIAQVRILGWSMGGNIGVDFTIQHPELVVSLTLAAVRNHWSAEDIDFTRQGLFDATGVGMETFYRKCFLGAKADYRQFANTLLSSYAQKGDVDLLDAGLTYLASYRMVDSLPLPVHIIQGEKDVVCPVAEMVKFGSDTKTTMLAGAGHFLFSHAFCRCGI